MSIEYIPPRGVITVEDFGNSLKIVVPYRTELGYLLYILYLSLTIFFPFIAVLLYYLFSGGNGIILCVITLLLLIFGFLVVILDLFNFSQIYRNLNGCETLVVTEMALYVSRNFNQKPTEYLLRYITDFRPRTNFQIEYLPVGRRSMLGNSFDIKVRNATGGGLCFTYEEREVRIANGADALEGRRILDAIQQKFPVYKAVISPKIGYTDNHLTR